jgi:hypothetical protein
MNDFFLKSLIIHRAEGDVGWHSGEVSVWVGTLVRTPPLESKYAQALSFYWLYQFILPSTLFYYTWYLCIKIVHQGVARSTTRSRCTRQGLRFFWYHYYSFSLIYLNCELDAAPQTFFFKSLLFIHFNLYEWCIRCRITTRSRGTRWGTRLLLLLNDSLFSFIWILHQVTLHNKDTTRSRGIR